MSSYAEIVTSVQRPAKRRRIDQAEDESLAYRDSCAIRSATNDGRVYSGTSLNDQSCAIFGDVNGDVHFNYSHDSQAGRGKAEEKRKYETLLKSLLFTGMDARLRNIEPELESTCQWLIEHQQFATWKDEKNLQDHHGFLWIKGKPGCGKSTIMRVAYYWAKKEWPGQVNLCYFFNGRAPSQLEKSSLGLYRSLTHQVLCALPDSRPVFVDKFASKEMDSVVEDWTTTELKDFLQAVLLQLRDQKLNCFIDALDEGTENDIRELVAYLERLGRLAANGHVNLWICLSSRHYPHISIAKGLSLDLDKQLDHDKDIKLYIRTNLPGDESVEMLALQQEIFGKSNSVFLWVVLVVPMLKKVYDQGGSLHIEATRGLLASLPEKLDDLFAEILAKNEESIDQCVSLSQWVLFATRALTPLQLYLAIQYSCPSDDAPVHIPTPERVSKCLLNWSRGLVEITRSEPPTIQFIHETVRSFLLSTNGLSQMKPTLVSNVEGLSHETLRDACARYVERAHVPKGKGRRKTTGDYNETISKLISAQPLIEYATYGLLQHADSAQYHDITQTIFLQRLSESPGNIWQTWIQFHNYFERFLTGHFTPRVSLLYAVSKLDLPHLVQCLALSSETVNIQGERHGCSLGVACWFEHEQIVEFLLQSGANPNLLPSHLQKIRRHAGDMKSTKIMRLLHDYNHTQSANLARCLRRAIILGDVPEFQLLVGCVTDFNMEIGFSSTLLTYACMMKRTRIVQLLLEKNIEVNFRDNGHETPLYAAVASNCVEIVRMLLEAGANINDSGNDHDTALHFAVMLSSEKMIRLLLRNGADVNIAGGSHGSPLAAAAYWGLRAMLVILLVAGANANARVEPHGSVLTAALERPSYFQPWIVEGLLEAGADTQSSGWETADTERVPLFVAARRGWRKTVDFLVDAEADIEMKKDFLKQAIHWATVGEDEYPGPHKSVIELLQLRLSIIQDVCV